MSNTSHSQKPGSHNSSFSKTRRQLLKLLGISAGLPAAKVFAGNDEKLADSLFDAANFFADRIELTLYRPQDFLELNMRFLGYKKGNDNKTIVRSSSPNLLFVEFYPQSIAEQAWEEKGGEGGQGNFDSQAKDALNWNIKNTGGLNFFIINNNSSEKITGPAKSFIAGKTRLVFEIPESKNSIGLTSKDLLDWSGYKLVVSKRATCTPAFSAADINQPAYKGVISNENIKVPDKVNTQQPGQRPVRDVQNNNNNQPVQAAPTRVIRNPQPDTLRRQVQVNRDLRAATKDEQKEIQRNEMPVTLMQQQSGISAAVINFLIGNKPHPINESETSIEMPYRLFLSPNQFAKWYHEHELKNRIDLQGTALSTYELWHSKLMSTNCSGGIDRAGATRAIKTVRALWGTDIDGNWNQKPIRDYSPDGSNNNPASGRFVTALYNDDRHCIVHQSSNFGITGFAPKPVQVNNLMLSTLGAWLDAELLFKRTELSNVLSDLNMLKWKHIATLARDHYVEVVYAGNMLPFGHEAALVRITERKPKDGFAANWQRYFIVINEEEKKYNPYRRDGKTFKGFPFSTIKFVTTVTPTIQPPKKFVGSLSTSDDQQFVPVVNGKPFNFKIIGYDLDGGEVSFEMPMVFVSTNVSLNDEQKFNEPWINSICTAYNSGTGINNEITLSNQKLALARSQTKGDTHFEAEDIKFRASFADDEAPGFYPGTGEIGIYVNAVENITGSRNAIKVFLNDDKNKGNVFARLKNAAGVNFTGSGNKTGGSLSPNFSIKSLSKTLGAVGGNVGDMENMNFKPGDFFDSSAKLFGVIQLKDIIAVAENASAVLSGGEVKSPIPALKNIETDNAFITQYTWSGAALKEFGNKFFKFVPKGGSSLKVVTNLYRYKSAQPNSLTVSSGIENFQVEIASLAAVKFKKVGFYTGANAKTDFTIEMENPALEFLGPLTFVNSLQKFIPADGFSDPPFLDITTEGVTTGYTLALPDIQLGAFTLRNVNLGASVNLPFTGAPMVLRFNFCEKHQPFTLTVSALGGGGFFAIAFDVNGLQSLEAALEFGAAVSINLGVASGAVSIMGGIYFKVTIQADDSKTYNIEGYVRINGALSVLGLITVSVEFLLTLAGEISNVAGKEKVKRVWGEATLKVKVEVFMFSKTVSMKMTKEFAGAGADPTFGMLISGGEWEKYCDAFAA